MRQVLALILSSMSFSTVALAQQRLCQDAHKTFQLCATTRPICDPKCSNTPPPNGLDCSNCNPPPSYLTRVTVDGPEPISTPNPDAMLIMRIPLGIYSDLVTVLAQPDGTLDLNWTVVRNYELDAATGLIHHIDTRAIDALVLHNAMTALSISTTSFSAPSRSTPIPATPAPSAPAPSAPVLAPGTGGH